MAAMEDVLARRSRGRDRDRGMTLIELMIAVVVVALLAMVAYPSYLEIILRNNRTVAHSALTELASRQESFFVQHKRYADTIRELGYPSSPTGLRNDGSLADLDQDTPNDLIYRLQLSSAAPFNGDNNYRIEAVPAGRQASDSDCGTLFLTAAGTRGATGDGDNCW